MKKLFLLLLGMAHFLGAPVNSDSVAKMAGAASAIVTTFNATVDALSTDCEKLQYLINYKVQGCKIVTESILHYLIYKDYDGSSANFDSCNIGYIHGGDDNVLTHPAVLADPNFTSASMIGTLFNYARFSRAIFKSATLTGTAVFDYSHAISGINFESADLTDASFQSVVFENPSFSGATLTTTKFQHATLHSPIFDGAVLDGANFEYATLTDMHCNADDMPTISDGTENEVTLPSGKTTSSAAVFCNAFTHGTTHN